MKSKKHFTSEIQSNREIAEGLFCLSFRYPLDLTKPVPGQFLTIRVADSTVPLLRRPFAFSAFNADLYEAEIIYQLRGPGTTILSELKEGSPIDIIAPLGRPFPNPQTGRSPVLLGGGIGIGPVLFLARELESSAADSASGCLLLIGARNARFLPEKRFFSPLEPELCTDDGSLGYRGLITDLVRSRLKTGSSYEFFACGPDPMLEACSKIAEELESPCWVSMEQTMGCALGACMGCVIRVKSGQGYARVCTEGPVFDAREVLWGSR
jgi:dihydroorotate dehydrogenase electron transfer subunit